MFYKRWSSSVALPFGPQWGDPDNGKGGVAACMAWSRKEDGNKRPATTMGLSRRPPVGPSNKKSALQVTGKSFSFRPERERQEKLSLDEKEVVNAVHRASRQSVTRRPATATGGMTRSLRPFNPTPPPLQHKMFQDMKRNGVKSRTESPEEVTGWTYKFKEKNIYDLYDTDGFYSPSTPSRSNSVAGYVPSPDAITQAIRSRNDYRSPQQVGNETEFAVHTKGSRAALQNVPQHQTIERRMPMEKRKGQNNRQSQPEGPNDAKYETLSNELDRAIQTIRDLTRFQKETLGLYQNQAAAGKQPVGPTIPNPAFSTTYDRDFNTKLKNGTLNGYHGYKPQSTWETAPAPAVTNGYSGTVTAYNGYKPQPPPQRQDKTRRDFVKENARPLVAPREAWNTSVAPSQDNSKVHTLRGPNGLMTIRVDCGDKPVKNITVRVLDDKKAPHVTFD